MNEGIFSSLQMTGRESENQNMFPQNKFHLGRRLPAGRLKEHSQALTHQPIGMFGQPDALVI
jgi:hypothetical protein